jgi:hypothetical protein
MREEDIAKFDAIVRRYIEKPCAEGAVEVMQTIWDMKQASNAEMWKTAEEYYEILYENKDASPEQKEAVQQRLDDLLAPYSNDIAYYAFLKIKKQQILDEGMG